MLINMEGLKYYINYNDYCLEKVDYGGIILIKILNWFFVLVVVFGGYICIYKLCKNYVIIFMVYWSKVIFKYRNFY